MLKRRVGRIEAELGTEFPEAGEWIEQIVGDLVSQGYLNDRTYALSLARQMQSRGSSGQRIQTRLKEKGVPGDLVLNVIGEILGTEAGGDFEAALDTLLQADEINSADSPGGRPAEVAFIAMSLFRLGRDSEGKLAYNRLAGLMDESDYASQEVAQGYLREATKCLADGVLTSFSH